MSLWRQDLWANASRRGVRGALIGWFMNPGFAVATLHRMSHWGHRRGGPVGRLVSICAWRRIVKGYGCYIAPSARIGPGLRLPHPVGIVIGDDTVIGAHCTIYQHVTFGRRNERSDAYPVLGQAVVIYAGAVVIGGIAVGDEAVIGAQRIVMADVTAKTVVR